MLKELIVNYAPHETRGALLENSTVAEVFIEREDDTNIAGNIYKGRVQRVLPGMQAAFVDIGFEHAAFIYVDDVVTPSEQEAFQKLEEENPMQDEDSPASEDEVPDISANANQWEHPPASCPIEALLTQGQEIMVQVTKSSIGTKGPRVTTHISLAGRYLVLMPTVNHIGVSRRIEDESERTRLKEMIQEMESNPFGYIFRTQAEGIDRETLEKEIRFLTKTWEEIQQRHEKLSATNLLYKDLNATFRAIRDLMGDKADRLVIDSPEQYESIREFISKFMPDSDLQVSLYQGKEGIFDAYNIEAEITRALKKKVWLRSGGYIIIEPTEALVVIDVNTGRYVGTHDFDDTILKTNLEAVREIADQIRLRNIGGIIIIDFIDMKKESHKEKVMNLLREAVANDKAQINILPLTELGIVQMTRKRIRKNLTRTLCEPCFYCNGHGHLLSGQSICHKIYRDLLSEAQDIMGNSFSVRVHPKIAELLHTSENHLISDIENRFSMPVSIYPKSEYHLEEYRIVESMKDC